MLKDFGGPDWFLLGDKDLALNLERTRLLHTGMSLTEVTNEITGLLNVADYWVRQGQSTLIGAYCGRFGLTADGLNEHL